MRRWTTALATALALSGLFALAACDGGGRGAGNGNGTTSSTGTTGGTTGSSTGSTGGTTVHVNPGTTTGSSTGSTTSGNNCGVQNFTLDHGSIPELLIVQDRSGSMMENPDGSGGLGNKPAATSKWAQMVAAIEQTVGSLTMIQWGLEMFPQVGQDDNGGGCTVETALDVAVGPNTGAAITSALNAASPGGTTPTAAAINEAVSAFTVGMVDNDGHPKYILLATDGEPDCSTDPQMMDDPNTDAETAVSTAVADGIKVFVAGIGTGAGDVTELTKLANLGGMPNTTAGATPYYQVSTTSDLVNALNTIAGQIVSCSYALTAAPMSPDLVTIQSDGHTVPHDTTHMNGWDYGSMDMSIIFYGAACSDLQNGVVQSVSAVYGCPPVS